MCGISCPYLVVVMCVKKEERRKKKEGISVKQIVMRRSYELNSINTCGALSPIYTCK